MRIGILKTGRPHAEIEPLFGSYSDMMSSALGAAFDYSEFDAVEGGLPTTKSGVDAYVVLGSASSAYDDDPWIARLRDWLKELDPAAPLIGICFGHQIMAQAYGGVVQKASKGWAMGLHEYEVRSHEEWMDDAKSFVIPVSHYDQVVQPPSTARLSAGSDFCTYAALSYGDRRAVSFQGHPEFSLDFMAWLIDRRLRAGVIAPAQAEQATDSMQRADDRARVMIWIRRFLNGAAE